MPATFCDESYDETVDLYCSAPLFSPEALADEGIIQRYGTHGRIPGGSTWCRSGLLLGRTRSICGNRSFLALRIGPEQVRFGSSRPQSVPARITSILFFL